MRYLIITVAVLLAAPTSMPAAQAELKAGAAMVDVSPIQFPVLVNGGMTSRSSDKVVMKLHARAIVLDNGAERLAIVVVDSCMMTRQLLDDAKHLAAQRTRIRPDRMLISATHTHTAPSSMGCLGTDQDLTYTPYLRDRLAEVIAEAEKNLEPAEAGWAVTNAADYTALRRWIIRPDRVINDPFGNPTVRANMHAGANPDNVTGESGPEDPDLSMISFRSVSGRPIALLANFSMHYFSGVQALHPDYFGLFCEAVQSDVAENSSAGTESTSPPFVAIMSHGCSGDIWRRDYTVPDPSAWKSPTIEDYTRGLVEIAVTAYRDIRYSPAPDLAMAEMRLPMRYRVPDRQRLEWAQRIVDGLDGMPAKTTEEVYAREQVILHELQSTEIVVQALRIGDIAIASTPNETYALTGLKIKLQSPLKNTMVIELANGGDGYIPPPEQHLLGGYNTWAARSAGLEVTAEPRIAEAALQLLEQVTGKQRTQYSQSWGPAASDISSLTPAAWWRMDEMAGPYAADSSDHGREGLYEPGVVFFLEGPRSDQFNTDGETNRAAHFAGGRLRASMLADAPTFSVSMWFWNGMPAEGRGTAGWLFSRDHDHGLSPSGLHLGVGGTATSPGRLIVQRGRSTPDASLIGRTPIARWTWNHVVLVRDLDVVRVYLNGNEQPEIEVALPGGRDLPAMADFFLGGRSDNQDNWEGRLDEIAVFNRPLTVGEVKQLAAIRPQP